MKMKRLLAGLLCGIMALGFASCAGTKDKDKNAGGSDSKTLTIWAWDENFNIKAANEAKEIYTKAHPDVTVNVVTMAQDDIIQKLNSNLASNQTKGLPDIVLIEDYRIQNYLTSFKDQFRPLNDVATPADFMDYKLKTMTVGSDVYGVPFDSGVAALFYRADYLEQAGYKKEDMQNLTWEQYIEIGKKVKEKTGKYMLTLDPSDIGQIRIMLQSAGSWYMKEDGQTVDVKDNQALKDAITIYKNIVKSGIAKNVSDWDSFVGAFQKGDVASVPTGCWISPSITASADQSGKWAIASIPRMGANSKSINASSIGGASWYVLKNVGNADLAANFLKETFASNTDLMNNLANDINLVSTLKASNTTANYNKGYDYYGGQEIFKDFSAWTEKVPTVNYGLHTYAIEDILTESVQAIVNGADMQSTLDAAQTQASSAVVS